MVFARTVDVNRQIYFSQIDFFAAYHRFAGFDQVVFKISLALLEISPYLMRLQMVADVLALLKPTSVKKLKPTYLVSRPCCVVELLS